MNENKCTKCGKCSNKRTWYDEQQQEKETVKAALLSVLESADASPSDKVRAAEMLMKSKLLK